jgi:hypothetical protein
MPRSWPPGHRPFRRADLPDFEDFGEILLRSPQAGGYIRVDWFTADGLPTWGDGRLTILGTEGTIELRKYVDIAGRPGTDHVFLVDKTGTRHIDASQEPLTYFRNLVADIGARSETAMARPCLHGLPAGAGGAGQGRAAAGQCTVRALILRSHSKGSRRRDSTGSSRA